MRNWFNVLKFQKVSNLVGCIFLELDTYADYKFDNGIWIRIVTGEHANAIAKKPFEMIVRKPYCNAYSVPKLNKKELILKMEKLHNINIKTLNN